MAKSIGYAVILGLILLIIGLIVGYVIFGKTVNGKYIPPTKLINMSSKKTQFGKELENLKNDMEDFFTGTNIPKKRTNIMIFGGVGLLLGSLVGFFVGSKK